MAPTFLIRFDDVCPTMRWDRWERIEHVLADNGVSPLLAVVPDNQDPSLVVGAANERFWDRVRGWQAKGWAIGLHGHQHLYTTKKRGLVGLRRRSEFAGLDPVVQGHKLDLALAVFNHHGVTADAWVAPGHTFDLATLAALVERRIRVVSDGFSLWPVERHGALWVPQQLWRLRPRPTGVWTVCYHHNTWSDSDVLRFEMDVRAYRSNISSLPEVAASFRHRTASVADRLAEIVLPQAIVARNRLGAVLRGLRT